MGLPINVVYDYYTLNWVPNNINKIYYSTNFGVSAIHTKYNELYSKFLKRINHLLVREDNRVKLIKDIINKKAELVCDPTLLLISKDLDEVAVKDRVYRR